jgi:hypothetical protein
VMAQGLPLGRAEGRPEDRIEHSADDKPGEDVDGVPGYYTHRVDRTSDLCRVKSKHCCRACSPLFKITWSNAKRGPTTFKRAMV